MNLTRLGMSLGFLSVLVLALACGSNGRPDAGQASDPPGSSPALQSRTPRPLTSLDLPVKIAVTLPVFEDFVRRAGGDHAEVFSLVPPGVAPENYEFTEDDIASMEGVLFFYVNGMGIDDHLQEAIEQYRDEQSYVIPFGPNVRSPTMSPMYADESGDEAHLWLDPDLAAVYVAIVADEFVIYDEVNRIYYDERLAEEIADLKGLGNDLAEEVEEGIPEARRLIVTHSEALTHLARRFSLEVVATALGSGINESRGETVDRLVQAVVANDVPAVFAEYGRDDEIMRAVAAEAGVEVCTLYTDVADAGLLGYEEMMRANVAEMIRCLAEPAGGS